MFSRQTKTLFRAQDSLKSFLALRCTPEFRSFEIIIRHIKLQQPGESKCFLYLCGDCDDLLPLRHQLLQAVNELLESLAAPLEIVEGFVQSIKVTIPWAALVTDHCTLEVTGLQITCRPKDRTSKSAASSQPGRHLPGDYLTLFYDLFMQVAPGIPKAGPHV